MISKAAMLVLAVTAMILAAPNTIAQDDDDSPRRSSQPSLSQRVALGVQEALNLSQTDPPQIDAAIARLNKIISDQGDRLNGYDKATVYEIRGSFKAQKDDLRGALSDFQTAVNTGALPPERANGLRYYIAQVQFQLEQFDAAIRGLREWIRITQAAQETVPANAYYLLALAYVQKDDFRPAQQPMENALAQKNRDGDPDQNYYNILNLIYSENAEHSKRAALLERMINIWPGEASYWVQLTGAYAINDRDREAFSVLEVAYRAGLLTKEEQIIQLIQYYSFFDNAYRGAKLLEREMEAGVVERNQDNLILLSQLWDQSREAKKAIPILRQAAQGSSDGALNFRLGRVLVADEQYSAAEKELQEAIRKGGLSRKEQGDLWMLLGNARFSQAATDDIPQLRRAREAFQRAVRFTHVQRSASRWVAYIDELIRVYNLGIERAKAEKGILCASTLERLTDQKRVLQLQGQDTSRMENLTDALQDDLRECNFDVNGNVIGAAPEAEPAAEAGEGEE